MKQYIIVVDDELLSITKCNYKRNYDNIIADYDYFFILKLNIIWRIKIKR